MKPIFTLLLLVLTFGLLAQEKTYSISGRVNVFKPKGYIYIFLCNNKSFDVPFSGIDTAFFVVDYNKKVLDYMFEDIPAGDYAISCFQDLNKNQKLNKLLFWPIEPWGFSFSCSMKYPPKFEDVSFSLVDTMRVNVVLGK